MIFGLKQTRVSAGLHAYFSASERNWGMPYDCLCPSGKFHVKTRPGSWSRDNLHNYCEMIIFGLQKIGLQLR
jgi:hypothetical protein